MSIPPLLHPIEEMRKSECWHTLLDLHRKLELYHAQNCGDDGRLEGWFVKKINGYVLDDHEWLEAVVIGTCPPKEIYLPNNLGGYHVRFQRTPDPRNMIYAQSTENLAKEPRPRSLFQDPPNRRYEISTKFNRDLEKILPDPPPLYIPKDNLASNDSPRTASMSNTPTSRKSLSALADSVYGKALPTYDSVWVFSPTEPLRESPKSTYAIDFVDPSSLHEITSHTIDLSDHHYNAPRKHLYFYELISLAAIIHNRRGFFRLFHEGHLWWTGMIAHVIRVYLEIDIAVYDGDQYHVIGGEEDPGEEVAKKAFGSEDIRNKAWYARTPRNATLKKVVKKLLDDKERWTGRSDPR